MQIDALACQRCKTTLQNLELRWIFKELIGHLCYSPLSNKLQLAFSLCFQWNGRRTFGFHTGIPLYRGFWSTYRSENFRQFLFSVDRVNGDKYPIHAQLWAGCHQVALSLALQVTWSNRDDVSSWDCAPYRLRQIDTLHSGLCLQRYYKSSKSPCCNIG